MSFDGEIVLVLLGIGLLAGYAAHIVGARAHVPRVTLLLLLGVAAGPSVLDIVPPEIIDAFPLVARLALAVVAFLLGAEFVGHRSRHRPRTLGLALVVTFTTFAMVTAASIVVGAPISLAIILGSIGTATAPAATVDVVREARASGTLTDTVLGIVAVDDLISVTLFCVTLAVAQGLSGEGEPIGSLLFGLWQIGGAALLGLALGVPMAWLTGRLRPGEPAILEVLGFVVLSAGLASLIEVSFLLTGMVLGGTVALRARHHTRAVHEIDGLNGVVLALFFLMAGLNLEPRSLPAIGILGMTYVASRALSRLLGSLLGSVVVRAPLSLGRDLGWCLMPQAGVALGLGLMAAERLPGIAEQLMPLVIGSTVVFELAGPVLTRWRLVAAREAASS